MDLMVAKNVFNMEREELMRYLYDYIVLRKDIINFEQKKNVKLTEINNTKERKIQTLNNKFNDFSQTILHKHTIKSKQVSNKINTFLDYPPSLFRYYWMSVLIIRLLFINGLGISSLFSNLWHHTWVSLLIALGIFIFKRPLFKIFKGIVNLLLIIYQNTAKMMDASKAKSKGISSSNVAEVYNYPTLYNDIDTSYNDLYDEVKNWNLDYYHNQTSQASEWEKFIPDQIRSVGYLSFIYKQLYIGAADNWKEAVNILNAEIRHAETTGYLRSLSKDLESNTQQLIQLDNKIDRAFSDLSSEISHSCNQINSRIDGLFDGYFYY
ncbi:MAG: hypothetical protein ACTJHC_03450 [Vagococcus sp.]